MTPERRAEIEALTHERMVPGYVNDSDHPSSAGSMHRLIPSGPEVDAIRELLAEIDRLNIIINDTAHSDMRLREIAASLSFDLEKLHEELQFMDELDGSEDDSTQPEDDE
jgi:uncharacterized NAD-dependent epimerase/dehydratase family protein